MAKVNNTELKLAIELNMLEDFVARIKDLTTLDNMVYMKFNNEKILLYCLSGAEKSDAVHAFKNHQLDTKVYFGDFDNSDDFKFCITNAKTFYNSVSMFIKYMNSQKITDKLSFTFVYNEDYFVERVIIKNKKSQEQVSGGDVSNFRRKVTVEQINELMDKDKALFSFDLSKADYDYIKSKTLLEKDPNDACMPLYLNVKNNSIFIGETKWEHNVCDFLETPDDIYSFPKKFFKCINFNGADNVIIYVFDGFIMIEGLDSILMIVTEMTV